jgi:hypothetical protein
MIFFSSHLSIHTGASNRSDVTFAGKPRPRT